MSRAVTYTLSLWLCMEHECDTVWIRMALAKFKLDFRHQRNLQGWLSSGSCVVSKFSSEAVPGGPSGFYSPSVISSIILQLSCLLGHYKIIYKSTTLMLPGANHRSDQVTGSFPGGCWWTLHGIFDHLLRSSHETYEASWNLLCYSTRYWLILYYKSAFPFTSR